MQFAAFFVALALFLVLAAVLRLDFRFKYRKEGTDDLVWVRLSTLYGIISYRVEVPVIEWVTVEAAPGVRFKTVSGGEERGKVVKKLPFPKLPQTLPPLHRLYSLTLRVLAVNAWLFERIHLKKFLWKSQIGFDDAALTGIAGGALWGMKTWLFNNLRRAVNVDVGEPEIDVRVDFDEPRVDTEFDCIFSIRLGYIIVAGLRMTLLAVFSYFFIRRLRLRERPSN